eukprot:5141648-Amphidinium_carterae.1
MLQVPTEVTQLYTFGTMGMNPSAAQEYLENVKLRVAGGSSRIAKFTIKAATQVFGLTNSNDALTGPFSGAVR